jgi:transcription elongation GreA/GreB family factor
MTSIKDKLYLACNEYIASRAAIIKQNIAEAQEAANDDTKSSAGDKFEVGREMMQQEIELNFARLGDLHKLKQALEQVSPSQKSTDIQLGSIVATHTGQKYYVAISAGKLLIDGATYYAISPEAPVALLMLGKKVGDTFLLNGKEIQITEVI